MASGPCRKCTLRFESTVFPQYPHPSGAPAGEYIQKQYGVFRGEALVGDTTPEVFLLMELIEMMGHKETEVVLEELGVGLSPVPALAEVIAHFKPLFEEALAEL